MTISFSGLASGLDTSSWIEALTSIRQLSVTSLQNKQNSISSEQAEINKIQSMFSNVQTALDRITDSKFGGTNDLFIQKSVDTNGAESFTATVTSSALLDNYNIYVEQLATATVATSTHEVSHYIDPAHTTFKTLGVKSGSLTIYVDGIGATTIDVDEDMTISQFNTYIRGEGITATLSVDEEGHLNFVADNKKKIQLNYATDESNFLTKLGLKSYTNYATGSNYYRSQNSFYAMGLDTTLAHEASDNVYNGTNRVGTGKIRINNLEFEVTSTSTLGDLINAINNRQDLSLATAVWDDAEGKLRLTATREGHSHIIIDDKIAGTNNHTGFAAAFGLDDANAQETGQNAIININGSDSIYLSGLCTSVISSEKVAADYPVAIEGAKTCAKSINLNDLYTGEGTVTANTHLSELKITEENKKFTINGQEITYSKENSVNDLIAAIKAAGDAAADGQKFKASFDQVSGVITVTAEKEGDAMLDFDSTVGDSTSLLAAKFGFTRHDYAQVSHMLDDAIDTNDFDEITTVMSTGRINASTATYYSQATSKTLTGVVSDNLSAFGNSSNVSLGLSGDYEIKVNGHYINFTASESMGILLSKISEVSGVTANYVDNKLVITSDIVGSNLRIEDVQGNFAYKMGYTNEVVNPSTGINTSNYDPDTHSIEAEVSTTGTQYRDMLTSADLSDVLGNVNGATKLWQLGIEDSVISIAGTNLSVSSNWSVTQFCNQIEQNVSDVNSAYFDTLTKSVVLKSEETGGTSPISVSVTSGNVADVLGWTNTYSTITGSAPVNFSLESQNYTVANPGGNVISAANVNQFSTIVANNDVIGLSDYDALHALQQYVSAGNSCVGKTFCLTNDINLDGHGDWTAIGYTGDDEAVQHSFNGNFNGNGYAIQNMTVSQGKMSGLFTYVVGGTISNLKITGASVSCEGQYAGIIASMASNAYISNCYTTGSVSSVGDEVGGLVGDMSNSTISNSYSLAAVSGRNVVGGIVGRSDNSTIINSAAYNSVVTTGDANIGGLVGQSNSTTYAGCTFYDTAHNALGNNNGTVNGVQRDLGAAPPTAGVPTALTAATTLSSLGGNGRGVLSINGVITESISGTDQVNDIVEKINGLEPTTKVHADLVGGQIKLTSNIAGQSIVVTDGNGSNTALILGLNPGYAVSSVTSVQNNSCQSTDPEPIWKATLDSKICENTEDIKYDIAEGSFWVNGYEFTLDENTTIRSLIDDVEDADIGVRLSYNDGKLKFYSTIGNNFTMTQGNSNFTEKFGFTKDTTTTTYTQNTAAFTSSLCFDTGAKIVGAQNLFEGGHTVTEGTFYVNGVEFNIDENTTLAGLIEDINQNNQAYAVAELDYTGSNVKLKITSRHPSSDEVSVLGGTSNFTDVVKMTHDVPELFETEQNYTLGWKTEYKDQADLSSKLVGNNQFNKKGDLEFEEGIFTINGVNFTVTNLTTLGGIIDDINGSAAGVNAYWNSQEGKLTITSKYEGDTKIKFTDGDSNFLTVMRLCDATQTLGTDGYYSFTGGSTYTSNSNIITSDITGIEGLTINLTGQSRSVNNKLVADKLSVTNDTSYLEASVLDFVDMYNELVTELDSVTSTTGMFHKDVGLKSLASQLRSTLNATSNTGSTNYKMLAQLGISTAAPGAALNSNTNLLSVDVNKLHRAVTTDISDVKTFMLGDNENFTNGVMTKLSNFVFSTMKSNGFFATRNSMYGSQLNRYNTLISTAQTRISNYRSSLETKFSSMEKLISSLQSAYSKMYGTLGINSSSVSGFFG